MLIDVRAPQEWVTERVHGALLSSGLHFGRALVRGVARRRAASRAASSRLLAFAGRMMARANLILVDVLSAGVAPPMVRELSRTLQEIQRVGGAILLVERNAAMALAGRACLVMPTRSLPRAKAGVGIHALPSKRAAKSWMAGLRLP